MLNDSRCAPHQRYYSKQLETKAYAALKGQLSEIELQLLNSQGGTGASILHVPRRAQHLLGDDEFAVAIRRRLLMQDPAGSGGLPCQNASSRRNACGAATGAAFAEHASKCHVGPGFVRRHNWIRDALADWLVSIYGQAAVVFEQRIPG